MDLLDYGDWTYCLEIVPYVSRDSGLFVEKVKTQYLGHIIPKEKGIRFKWYRNKIEGRPEWDAVSNKYVFKLWPSFDERLREVDVNKSVPISDWFHSPNFKW